MGLITAETMREHRATWWAWSCGVKMRHTAKMRGTWGYDVTCSCGFETRTGGATRGSVQRELDDHRLDAQMTAARRANGRRIIATGGDHAGRTGLDTWPDCPGSYTLIVWDDGDGAEEAYRADQVAAA